MSSSTPRPRTGTEEIAARFEASPEAAALLAPGLGASDYVAALVEKELWGDAAGFVGQWLGKRDAVMWACLASKKALGPAPPPKERAALEAAERWLAAVDEPSRRACEAAAEALVPLGPGDGGRSGRLERREPLRSRPAEGPPPENLTGKGAAGSVLLAGAAAAPDVTGRLRELIWLGVDIADGRHRPGGPR